MRRWIRQNSGVTSDLNEISEANGELWAVGVGGLIRHYDGTAWSTQASPYPGITLQGVQMVAGNPVTGLAVGEQGTIIKYDGTSWEGVSSHQGGGTFITLCRISATEDFIVGYGGVVMHSVDGGAHFNQETTPSATNYYSCGGPPGNIYLSGVGGVIMHSSGNGTWTPEDGHTTNALRTMIWFGSGGILSEIWLTGGTPGSPGIMLHSGGDGTWTPVAIPGQPVLRSLRGTAPNDIFAVGTGGAILHFNGTGWSAQSSGTTTQLNFSAHRPGADGGEWWGVGNGGTTLLGIK